VKKNAKHSHLGSGARKNLKVGGTRRGGNCFCRAPTILALKVYFIVSVSAFMMVNTVWSVSSLLFFYILMVSSCPAICKNGGTCPFVPYRFGVGATAFMSVAIHIKGTETLTTAFDRPRRYISDSVAGLCKKDLSKEFKRVL